MIDDIKNQLFHIEEYVPKFEKDNFLQYQEKWQTEKNISDLWRDAESFRFPLFWGDGFYESIRTFSGDHIEDFIDLLSVVDSPMVLHDILFGTLFNRDNLDNILEVLKKAPLTVESIKNKDSFYGEDAYILFNNVIDSIIAPVALQILMWYPLQADENANKNRLDWGEQADEEDEKLLEKICQVLKSREDGFFLAYHYMKHLLRNERKNSGYYDVLNAISDAFEAKDIFISKDGLIIEGIEDDQSYENKFLTSGELYDLKKQEGDFEGDILVNYRTILWFVGTEGMEKLLYTAFKRIFPYQSLGFFTHDNKFYLKHYDIARVLLAQEDPVQVWSELMDMLSASIQRISCQYFGEQAMNIRYHNAFMWSVGQRMLDNYCENSIESDKSKSFAKDMWKVLWDKGIQYIRRFSRYIDEIERDYIASLICYYYLYFIRNVAISVEGEGASEYCDSLEDEHNNAELEKSYDLSTLMSYFYEIKEFPVICFTAMRMLENNKMDWWTLFRADERFFNDTVHKAQMIAEGQFRYKWITDYLKKQRYVHSKEKEK